MRCDKRDCPEVSVRSRREVKGMFFTPTPHRGETQVYPSCTPDHVQEIQRIYQSAQAPGGTFALTFFGESTAYVAHNATSEEVQPHVFGTYRSPRLRRRCSATNNYHGRTSCLYVTRVFYHENSAVRPVPPPLYSTARKIGIGMLQREHPARILNAFPACPL